MNQKMQLKLKLKLNNSSGKELIPKNSPVVAVISVGDIINKAGIEDLLKLDLNIIEDILEFSEANI